MHCFLFLWHDYIEDASNLSYYHLKKYISSFSLPECMIPRCISAFSLMCFLSAALGDADLSHTVASEGKHQTELSEHELWVLHSEEVDCITVGMSKNGVTVASEINKNDLNSPTFGMHLGVTTYNLNGTTI